MRARRGHSSLVGFIVTAVVAVPSFAYVMQNTLQHDPPNKMELTSSSGAVSITNSREGQAILTAAPMLPGTTTTGLVSLSNTGDGDETLTLDSSAPIDTPGPGGGHLSQRLRLRVEDVSTGNPVAVYEGSLSGLHNADLGTLQKSEHRTYRFVVTFPDGGANGADNAYQGSSATIGFDWTAGAAGPAEPPADAPLPEQIAGDAPDAYWPLDASQPEMTDAVGDHTGHWATSVTTATGTVPGGGQAASFNGIDGYGYVDSLAEPTQAYTLEAWVKPENTGDMVILQHGDAGALAIRSGHFAFRHVDAVVTATDAVKVGVWQQVVGTWDASSGKARLYVDGALAGEGDASAVPSGTAPFYIGRGTWGASGSSGSSATRSSSEGSAHTGSSMSYFHGDMAQVAYFQNALAPDRIAAHYDSGKVDGGGGTGTGGGDGSGTGTGGGDGSGGTGSGDGGGSGTGGDGGTTVPGTGLGSDVGQETTCPGSINAQGGASDERARKIAKAKARARARAKALARARARKLAKTRHKQRGKASAKRTATAKRSKPAQRSTCPGARAKTTKRNSG